MITINESGVTFGEFDPSNVLKIENVVDKKGIRNVKSVEFVLLRGENLIFLEAKSSVPRDSDMFFYEIRDKMLHSMSLFISSNIGRNEWLVKNLPMNLKGLSVLKKNFVFVLVIPNAPTINLPPLTEKLRRFLSVESKLWGIKTTSIYVLNSETAFKKKLILV